MDLNHLKSRQDELNHDCAKLLNFIGYNETPNDGVDRRMREILGKCQEFCEEFGLVVPTDRRNQFLNNVLVAAMGKTSGRNNTSARLYKPMKQIFDMYYSSLQRHREHLEAVQVPVNFNGGGRGFGGRGRGRGDINVGGGFGGRGRGRGDINVGVELNGVGRGFGGRGRGRGDINVGGEFNVVGLAFGGRGRGRGRGRGGGRWGRGHGWNGQQQVQQ